MKRRIFKFIGLFVCLAVLLGIVFWRLNQEPHWKGRPLSAWVADLKAKDPEVRNAAIAALNEMGPVASERLAEELTRPPTPLQRLNQKFGSYVPNRLKNGIRKIVKPGGELPVKLASADALRLMGSNGVQSIPALAQTLRSPNMLLASEAARALGAMGSNAVPPLVEALGDKDIFVRSQALSALGAIGPAAAPAAPVLAEIIQEGSGPLPGSASYILSRIGPEALPHVLPLLQSTNVETRRWAAYTLNYIGRPASNAVPALLDALRDPNPQVRWSSYNALHAIEWPSPRWVEGLTLALQDSEPSVQTAALQGMKQNRRLILTNLQVLLPLLDSSSADVRAGAAEVLGTGGRHISNAVPRLETLLHDPEERVRVKAREALEGIEEDSKAWSRRETADQQRSGAHSPR